MSNYPDDMNWRAYDAAQGTSNSAAAHEAEVRLVRALLPKFHRWVASLNTVESPNKAFTETVHNAAERIENALADIESALL